MDNARTTSNRLRTENQELKTETKELKKELGKMKDLFNSEQLEALRHHFPNISKAMGSNHNQCGYGSLDLREQHVADGGYNL